MKQRIGTDSPDPPAMNLCSSVFHLWQIRLVNFKIDFVLAPLEQHRAHRHSQSPPLPGRYGPFRCLACRRWRREAPWSAGGNHSSFRDPDGYRRLAENLAAYGVLGNGQRPSAFRPPLYPILLRRLAIDGKVPPGARGCFASGSGASPRRC